jgi:putative transposase
MLLVDARGVPLSIIVCAANRHDVTQLEPTLDRMVVRRPRPGPRARQHLCADAAFQGAPAEQAIRRRRYVPHVRPRGEEIRTKKRHPPRRWVVEVAHSWFNRFRKLLVRYEKTHRSYLALTMLAAAIICFRRVPEPANIIYG